MVKIILAAILSLSVISLTGCSKNSIFSVKVYTYTDDEAGVKCYYTNTDRDTAISCVKVK